MKRNLQRRKWFIDNVTCNVQGATQTEIVPAAPHTALMALGPAQESAVSSRDSTASFLPRWHTAVWRAVRVMCDFKGQSQQPLETRVALRSPKELADGPVASRAWVMDCPLPGGHEAWGTAPGPSSQQVAFQALASARLGVTGAVAPANPRPGPVLTDGGGDDDCI